MQETKEMRVPSLGQEDSLEEGMATHSSILAWKIPWTEEPGQATVHGVTKSRTRLKQLCTRAGNLDCERKAQDKRRLLRLTKSRSYPVKGRKERKSDLGREKNRFRGLEKSIRLEELKKIPYWILVGPGVLGTRSWRKRWGQPDHCCGPCSWSLARVLSRVKRHWSEDQLEGKQKCLELMKPLWKGNPSSCN